MATESRDVVEFARGYGARHELEAGDVERLSRRLGATALLLKAFRRALSVVHRYGAAASQREPVLAQLLEQTQTFHAEWGALSLKLSQQGIRSPEGFAFRTAADSELLAATFFPLFRDGITGVSIAVGVSLSELDTLVAVIACGGRREGDDSLTWLFSERLPHISLELAPMLGTPAALAMGSSPRPDPTAVRYIEALQTAEAFYVGADARSRFTTDSLDELASLGLDPDRTREALHATNPAPDLPPLSPQASETLRAHFLDRDERALRAGSVGMHASLGGRS